MKESRNGSREHTQEGPPKDTNPFASALLAKLGQALLAQKTKSLGVLADDNERRKKILVARTKLKVAKDDKILEATANGAENLPVKEVSSAMVNHLDAG